MIYQTLSSENIIGSISIANYLFQGSLLLIHIIHLLNLDVISRLVIDEYKKQKFKRFVFSDEERDQALAELGENREKAEVQRYKGLGEMEWQELKETTMAPENRKMKQVKITDAQMADSIFSVLMGDDVDPRRKFIEENAEYATLDV